jgi:hypothetical protein
LVGIGGEHFYRNSEWLRRKIGKTKIILVNLDISVSMLISLTGKEFDVNGKEQSLIKLANC